jgi:hypothetical protein
MIPPAPPLVIRQVPPRPRTPPPLIIREQPPNPPERIPRKVITITRWASGHQGPPPPRKVVIERLPQIPPKPRSVIIERWLPYEPQKRKVILHKGSLNENFFLPNTSRSHQQFLSALMSRSWVSLEDVSR